MTTWVLLRGWAREARHWERFPALLAHRCACEVLAIDLPGNGTRWRERSPIAMRGMADAVRQELAARGITGPVHVLGLSMGAMVAMLWASRHPAELASAVLVNSSAADLGAPWLRIRLRAWPALVRAAWHRGLAREQAVLSVCSNAPSESTAARWTAYAADTPTSQGNALRQLLAAARFRRPSARPEVPLLVIASASDRLVSPVCSMRLAADWDLPLRMHATTGHDLPLDDPQWLARACAEWAEDLAQSATPASSVSLN